MKRIKQIIEALRVLSRTPSKAIAKAAAAVVSSARDEHNAAVSEEEITLISNILAAIVEFSEGMEKMAESVKPRE